MIEFFSIIKLRLGCELGAIENSINIFPSSVFFHVIGLQPGGGLQLKILVVEMAMKI
jgi:hypothetical protein